MSTKSFLKGGKTCSKTFLDSPGQHTQPTVFTQGSFISSPRAELTSDYIVNLDPAPLELKVIETSEHGFSRFVAICFTVNYIMGTGFLALPWAFVQGGLISSSIALLLIAFISDVSKNFILESMARAEALVEYGSHEIQNHHGPNSDFDNENIALTYHNYNQSDSKVSSRFEDLSPLSFQEQYDEDEKDDSSIDDKSCSENDLLNEMDLIVPYGTMVNHGKKSREPLHFVRHKKSYQHKLPRAILSKINIANENINLLSVKNRKFEVPELCRIFFGNRGTQLYTLFVSFYLYLALWAYTSVFASALAKELPITDSTSKDYFLYALIFALLVIPLSCRELKEQVSIQVILAACRIFMVVLMTASVLAFGNDHDDPSGIATTTDTQKLTSIPLFNFSGLYRTLPIITYAFIFHHSIPGLSHPVSKPNKRHLKSIFQSTFVMSTLLYTFVAISVGICFGTNIQQSSNLNWKGFRGGTGELVMETDEEGNIINFVYINVAWWAKAISFFIVSFPALDVASAFPLCAITLGNNLLGTYHGEESHSIEVGIDDVFTISVDSMFLIF